jgi:prepilin-type processing-associated H-X9-DG protein
VKQKYAQPGDFICPANKTGCTFSCNPGDYNDFPQRNLVTYSFRIGCPKSGVETGRPPTTKFGGRQVIIADMSPVFENLPTPNETLVRTLTEALLSQNSPNHNARGQNILFCDGSVVFLKSRLVGPSLDDIFTIQNTRTYQGTEMPASEADAFLAP